jgi:hypothetical protein
LQHTAKHLLNQAKNPIEFMSKQGKANRTFIETATNMFFSINRIYTVSDFCAWLISKEILPENYINNWLAIELYKKELERTKTVKNAKGVKWIAINRVLEQIPMSRTKLYNLLKSKSVKTDKTKVLNR